MNGNVEFLNYIHQNSGMGTDTIKQLIGICKDEEYKKVLHSQLAEYKMIHSASNQKIKQFNKESKDINVFSKVSSYLMININTLLDKSPSHISEMLIQGSTMGIIDITKKLKEYPNADKEILDLASRLLKLEQDNVDQCKRYLQ